MEEFIQIVFTIIIGGFFLAFTLLELAWPILIPLLIISIIRKNKSNKAFKVNVVNNKAPVKETYHDISNSKLEEFDIHDINQLKDYIYEIFYNFEKAYNNLDYNAMYNNSTDKLYHNYHTNIMLNLKFAQKKIIDDIERKKVIIYDVLSTTRKQVISSVIQIKYVCYMQNHNGEIISGSINPTTESFEVTFVKDYGSNKNTKCPNCGATVELNNSICEYCGTNVRSTDFKIDSIKKIID